MIKTGHIYVQPSLANIALHHRKTSNIIHQIPSIAIVLKSLLDNMNIGPAALDENWLYNSPVHSDIEAKLRSFLVELGNAGKILGIQVCAYKDGKVIIDSAAGVLGKDDPRPVKPDSLFTVFSTTKGIASGMIHWLADKGKLKLDENVANIWPEFGSNGKDQIKVNHVLNHTAGLHNALAGIEEDPTSFCDYEECLRRIAMVEPETQPGCEQLYHYLSYGWLCGGIIEHASGKKFQDVLEEAFVIPLNLEGEFYIGIPPGVESRLATVTQLDIDEFISMGQLLDSAPHIPSSFRDNVLTTVITISNNLKYRQAIVPAANGHFSARAIARYYASLVDGGLVPLHHPSFPSKKTSATNLETDDTSDEINIKIFTNPKEKIHDAFLGRGEYKDLVFPNGLFELGFQRFRTADGSLIGFGHPGLGGSTGYCDINNRFAISVTLNKLSFGPLTGEVIRFVCTELDLPVPAEYADYSGKYMSTDQKPAIN